MKIALHDKKFVIVGRTSLLYISSLLFSMEWLKVNCNPDWATNEHLVKFERFQNCLFGFANR